MKLRDLTRCALCAALMAVCAWITIPLPFNLISFTMQTFAVFLTLGLLGGGLGTVSIIVYLMLGIVGLPVFSGFRGGFGVLLGPTGGYLAGFLVSGLVYWVVEKENLPKWVGMILGLVVCYAFGTVWYMIYSGSASLWAVLCACVFPFVIPDLAKIGLAMLLAKRLARFAQV